MKLFVRLYLFLMLSLGLPLSAQVSKAELEALLQGKVSGAKVAEEYLARVHAPTNPMWVPRVNEMAQGAGGSSLELCRFVSALSTSQAAASLDAKNRRLLNIVVSNRYLWLLEDRSTREVKRPDPKVVTEQILQLMDENSLVLSSPSVLKKLGSVTQEEQALLHAKEMENIDAGLTLLGCRENIYRLLHSEFKTAVTEQIHASKASKAMKEMIQKDRSQPNESTLRSTAMGDFHASIRKASPWLPEHYEWGEMVPVRKIAP